MLSTIRIGDPSTSRSGSLNASPRRAFSHRSGRSAAPNDNALAETINGLYKTELIKPRKPWRTTRKSSWLLPNGSTGSTTTVSTSTAEIFRRSKWRRPTTLATRDQPPAEFSHQKVSGHAVAVQFVSDGWRMDSPNISAGCRDLPHGPTPPMIRGAVFGMPLLSVRAGEQFCCAFADHYAGCHGVGRRDPRHDGGISDS